MKRRTVQVNLVLLGLAALWGYLLAANWSAVEGEDRLDPSEPEPEAAVASGRPAARASGSDAAAIADHHLFHPDRHNALPGEAHQEAAAALGPAPVLMGTMGIGGNQFALMVSRVSGSSRGLYRRLKVGEALDGYTLVRVEGDRVVMKVGDTEVPVGIDDRPQGSGATARPAARTQASGARSATTGVGSSSRRPAAAARRQGRSGRDVSHIPPRDLPEGTVRDGKRLVVITTPFGKVRRWVEDKPK